MCRVQCPDGKAGSGSLVDFDGRRILVFTAAHVLEGNASAKCSFLDGEVNGRVVVCDKESDCGAIELERAPQGATPVRLADNFPGSGQRVTLIGFGGSPRKGFLARGGILRGSTGNGMLEIAGAASHGDSGGAVLTKEGRLFGIISATSTDYQTSAYVAFYGPIRRLLGMQPRYQYKQEHGLPPFGQTQQGPGGGGNYVPPTLPDTSNLITRDEYEADKAKLIDLLRKADLLEDQVDAVGTQAQKAEQKAEQAVSQATAATGKADAVATESKSLIERLKEKLDGDVIKLDGKIAGLLDVDDAKQLVGQFTAEREKLITENMTVGERLKADIEAAKTTIAANKDAIKTEVLSAAESKIPKLPWGIINLAIGLATGGVGLGGAGLLTAILRRGATHVAGAAGLSGLAEVVAKLHQVADKLRPPAA